METGSGLGQRDRGGPQKETLAALTLGALGVVYGDIGTSPLYAFEISLGNLARPAGEPQILGVLSLMFWSLMIVVTFKYITLILRSDNRGEGGILALLALVLHEEPRRFRAMNFVLMAGLLGAAFFFADAAITPAISVLSAVEGLEVAAPGLAPFVIPITVLILVTLFSIQRRGTARVGALFGPIMVLWFLCLGIYGVLSIAETPRVLAALNPQHAVTFLGQNGMLGFLILGSVVLTVTGAEALYADMGHFGRVPIRIAWLGVALPGLTLNYLGQGALVLRAREAAENPFYLLAPSWALYPTVILATLATIIASQAVISGAYSLGRQAVQLGFLPRLQVLHTSETARGQIYAPRINWLMLGAVLLLVGFFHNSSALAGAYGVSVTGAMLVTTLLALVLRWNRRERPLLHPAYIFVPLMIVDAAFFVSSLSKVGSGGIVPLAFGLALFTVMTTWRTGRAEMARKLRTELVPLDGFIKNMATSSVHRVAGTAVFLTNEPDVVPPALLHNLKHNKVLHERVILLTIHTENVPHVRLQDRVNVTDCGHGFFLLKAQFGFMDEPDIEGVLRLAGPKGLKIAALETSFFLGRQTIVPAVRSRLSRWREALFIALSRTSQSASDYFRLPSNRVVELGTQLEI